MKKALKILYSALIFVFLYAPMVVLIVLSFNKSKSRAKWGGFTFDWYVKLFGDHIIMQALINTLLIAFISALVACIIGTIAALAMNKMGAIAKSTMLGVTNIPMLNADIVTGISLMLLFIFFRFKFGFVSILLAHITFNISYVILSVLPRIKNMNPSNYEAALDLGATPVYAFFKVILPDIWPGVLSGFLMAFTMSLDDFIITHFTKGAGVDTISTKVYAQLKKGIDPKMYALSTLIFISVLVLLILINTLPAAGKKKKAK